MGRSGDRGVPPFRGPGDRVGDADSSRSSRRWATPATAAAAAGNDLGVPDASRRDGAAPARWMGGLVPDPGGVLALSGPRVRAGRGPGAPGRAGRRSLPAPARPRPGDARPGSAPRHLQSRRRPAALRRAGPVRPDPQHHPGAGPVLDGVAGRADLDVHPPQGSQVPPRPGGDVGRRRLLVHPSGGSPASLRGRRPVPDHPGRHGVPGGAGQAGGGPRRARPVHRARDPHRGTGAVRVRPGGRSGEGRAAGAGGGAG